MATAPLRTFVCRNVCVTMFVLAPNTRTAGATRKTMQSSPCGRSWAGGRTDPEGTTQALPLPPRPEKLPSRGGSLREVAARWARGARGARGAPGWGSGKVCWGAAAPARELRDPEAPSRRRGGVSPAPARGPVQRIQLLRSRTLAPRTETGRRVQVCGSLGGEAPGAPGGCSLWARGPIRRASGEGERPSAWGRPGSRSVCLLPGSHQAAGPAPELQRATCW